MIILNDVEFKRNHYPDGTPLLVLESVSKQNNVIIWKYEDDAELFTIVCLAKSIQEQEQRVTLYMPYIPNARMDRVKDEKDVFTLKYFCDLINYCHFDKVYVLDPHSLVSEALIDRLVVLEPQAKINQAIDLVMEEAKEDPLVFYPDEGSMKRYSTSLNRPYAFGIKKRDWKTGNIEGLNVIDPNNQVKGKTILIVDDICSRGGTFYHSAKKLKELGAGKIYLYITHCENTILNGELLKSELVERVFTTNSIFTKEHEKITVMEV